MKHSKLYRDKKEELGSREKELRIELQNVSDSVSQNAMAQLKTAGLVLAGLTTGYLVYRIFFRSPSRGEVKVEKQQDIRHENKPPAFVTDFSSKLSDELIGLLVKSLKGYIEKGKF